MCVYVCLCILEFMCKCVCCRTVNMLFKNLIVFRGAETSNSVKRICDADKGWFFRRVGNVACGKVRKLMNAGEERERGEKTMSSGQFRCILQYARF